MMLPQFYMDDLIRQAIREDINYIDTSADYLIPPDQMGKSSISCQSGRRALRPVGCIARVRTA